jgi:hypothetical protein
LHCVACKFWLWAVYLRSEKKATLFLKKRGSKPISFQKVPISNFQTPLFKEKVLLFWISFFLVNGLDNPPQKLAKTCKCFSSIDWYQESLISSDGLLFLVPLQSVAILGPLVAFTAAYNINVLVSGYRPLDKHWIVLPVKFDGG